MRHRALLLLPAFLPCLHIGLLAQNDLHFDGSVPVYHQGNLLDLAWAGGLNFVQVSSIDLNGDGLKDLFLFDRSGNKVVTLLRTEGSGTGAYTVTRAYDDVYPFKELHDWALLRDFNCDGKEDIFSYSQAGFSVYRNISDANGPAFELSTFRVNSNYVTSQGNPVFANLYVSQVDLPGIVDVDGDGDLDVLTFSLLGSYVEYHKNLSMELYGHCDSLKFEVRNKCWGFFSENFSDNSVTLNVPCNFNVPTPEFPLEPTVLEYHEPDGSRAHAGSSVTPLDLTGNGVMDLLLGDISFNNLVGLYNGGTTSLALMTQEDTLFPGYDQSVDLPIFPGAFYVDVNGDNKRDLVVSPNSFSLAQNFMSMWYYRNTGTDQAPTFQFQSQDLFQDRMLEFGEGAYPVLFDHNGDGLMDLVVANHGYFQAGNTYQGRLALLQNTGSATNPAFELVTTDYMNLSTSGIGASMYPAFGDVDGDGDMDMYIGDLQGRIHFYRNVSTGSTAQFQLVQANVPDASGNILDVGQFATPQLHDLDGDGLLDLVIGERNGNLNYYRNTGSSSTPQWTLISENLGGVSTVEWWNITGHSVPFLFNNPQGQKEILLGSESGWLYHYGDIDNNVAGTWTLLDSAYMGIYEGHRTGAVLHDFTGDGVADLVIGNYRGGLSFWRSDEIMTTSGAGNTRERQFMLHPNPAAGQVVLEWLVEGSAPVKGIWLISSGLGQEVMRVPATGTRTLLDVEGLPGGVYQVHLEGHPEVPAQRLMVVPAAR
jgi:hypothetical protein